MLNFALCDDNEASLDRLSKILESIFIEHNLDAEVSFSCDNTDDLLTYVKNNNVSVLILDIDFKTKTTGIDLANKIREFNKNVYIIFTSAHLEYILIAYKCKTFDFLPKPITRERVEETILRLLEDINCEGSTQSFIHINNKKTIINQDDILFIKKDGMKSIFYTEDRTYETYNSFTNIINQLSNNFVRCHKSYIVNINKISNIDSNNNLILFNSKNHLECYIGPKYKKILMEVLNNEYFSDNLVCTNN